MAGVATVCWSPFSTAQCSLRQTSLPRFADAHLFVPARCHLTSVGSFLRGQRLQSPVARGPGRVRMSAEPELQETPTPEGAEDPELSAYEKELKVGKFKIQDVQEKYAVRESGKFECNSCGYEYKPEEGDSSYPVSRGTEFGNLPEDWQCPICGASRDSFVNKGVQLSGFVQNQGFGLGGNSLTSNQKSILIYGSLIFFFCLFLSGYFLQ